MNLKVELKIKLAYLQVKIKREITFLVHVTSGRKTESKGRGRGLQISL